MKHLPERIYLNFDFEPDQSDDFKDMVEVTHSCERIFKHDVEYIRKDVVLGFAKQFHTQCINDFVDQYINKNGSFTVESLFEEFLNNQGK
jgi:hypothetical protein